MAKRRKEPNVKAIKEVAEKIADTYEDIIEEKKKRPTKVTPRELVTRIVKSLENKNKIDIIAYDSLTKYYPQTKNSINNLISELRVFSIYDSEPHTVNFDYSAYLKEIEDLANIS